jgi:hypothetical protein
MRCQRRAKGWQLVHRACEAMPQGVPTAAVTHAGDVPNEHLPRPERMPEGYLAPLPSDVGSRRTARQLLSAFTSDSTRSGDQLPVLGSLPLVAMSVLLRCGVSPPSQSNWSPQPPKTQGTMSGGPEG